MAVQSKAWEQVGSTFDSLTDHLRRRFDEVGADAAADRAAFEKSLRALLTALEETLGSASGVVRDAELRRDLKRLAATVRKAMRETFETAGDQVRERLSVPVRRVRPAARPHASARPTPAKPKATPAKPKAATAKPKAATAKPKPATAKASTRKAAPRKRTAR